MLAGIHRTSRVSGPLAPSEIRTSENAIKLDFNGKVNIFLQGSQEIPVCDLYPETEYKEMLRAMFGKEIVFRERIVENVSDV